MKVVDSNYCQYFVCVWVCVWWFRGGGHLQCNLLSFLWRVNTLIWFYGLDKQSSNLLISTVCQEHAVFAHSLVTAFVSVFTHNKHFHMHLWRQRCVLREARPGKSTGECLPYILTEWCMTFISQMQSPSASWLPLVRLCWGWRGLCWVGLLVWQFKRSWMVIFFSKSQGGSELSFTSTTKPYVLTG